MIAILFWVLDSDPNSSNDVFSKCASYVSGAFMILFGLYFARQVATRDRIEVMGFNEVPSEVVHIPMADIRHRERSPSLEEDKEPLTEVEPVTFRQASASLCAGIVGGLVGPGGLLAIVPASYYTTKTESVLYMITFIISSTICMGLVGWVYGIITERVVIGSIDKKRQEIKLKTLSAGASILVGIIWIVLTAVNVIHLE